MMEQKLLKIKEGETIYTFRYYRYKVAEYLHKFINFITWTRGTDIGHIYRFSKEDLDILRERAQRDGVTYEQKRDELIERWHKQLIDNLVKQLEFDCYLDKFAEENEKGGLDVGFTFRMIAASPTQVLLEDNAMTIGG